MKTAIQWAENAKIYGDKAVSAVAVTIAFYHAKGFATPIDMLDKRYWRIKAPKKEAISRMRKIAKNLANQGMSQVYVG